MQNYAITTTSSQQDILHKWQIMFWYTSMQFCWFYSIELSGSAVYYKQNINMKNVKPWFCYVHNLWWGQLWKCPYLKYSGGLSDGTFRIAGPFVNLYIYKTWQVFSSKWKLMWYLIVDIWHCSVKQSVIYFWNSFGLLNQKLSSLHLPLLSEENMKTPNSDKLYHAEHILHILKC